MTYDSRGKSTSKKSLVENNAVEKLPDWTTFHAFWKKHYPHIKIPKPREDICEDCHKFVNAYKTAQGINESKKRKLAALKNGDDDSTSSSSAGEDAVASGASVPSLDEDDCSGEF